MSDALLDVLFSFFSVVFSVVIVLAVVLGQVWEDLKNLKKRKFLIFETEETLFDKLSSGPLSPERAHYYEKRLLGMIEDKDELAIGLIKDATRKAIILWIQKRALNLYHRWVKEKDRLNAIAREEGFSSLADEELSIGHIVPNEKGDLS